MFAEQRKIGDAHAVIEPNADLDIGGSDARIIMGKNESSLIRLRREKRGEVEPENLSANSWYSWSEGLITECANLRSADAVTWAHEALKTRHTNARQMPRCWKGRSHSMLGRSKIRNNPTTIGRHTDPGMKTTKITVQLNGLDRPQGKQIAPSF